jgi:hypothetical protein
MTDTSTSVKANSETIPVVVKSLSNVRHIFMMSQTDKVSDLRTQALKAFATKVQASTRPPMLIHNGKVLKDEMKIADCNIREKDVIVFMALKRPEATKVETPIQSEPVTRAPPTTATPARAPVPATAPMSLLMAALAQRAQTPVASASASSSAALAFPPASITTLTDLTGCPRGAAERAMLLTRGNVNAAAEILMAHSDHVDASSDEENGHQGQNGHDEIVVQLTPNERAIIARIQSHGFSRNQSIEAFLVCDRNEELATNYLLESHHS